jgi:hypothetical protein
MAFTPPIPTHPNGLLQLAAVILATWAFLFACGWLLVPRRLLSSQGKMLRLAVRLASGLVFATGIAAYACLKHLNYITWLALGQVALAAWWHWKGQRATQDVSEHLSNRWTWKEAACILGLLAVLLPVYHIPYQSSDANGKVLQLHADLGYYVDMVVALPESQAANGWAIFMGKDSEAACGVKDAWYHWGALMLATGIRAVSGLPAAPVTLVIVNALLNILLIVSAGALAERVTRTGAFASAAIGALAITCVHLLRLPQLFEMLALWLPYDIFHHARVPLALIFPYKFEGVLMLTSLALWQAGLGRAALGMLFLAACSAPHTVAAAGAAAGTLAMAGLVLRDRPMLRTGAFSTLTLLAGCALVQFAFRSSLPAPKSESIVGFMGFGHLWQIFRFGLLDSVVTLLLSALLLVGAVFWIKQGQNEPEGRLRALGWMCICAVIGSSFALQALRSADRFHVVVMSHAVLIMPVCACGLAAMLRSQEGRRRLVAIGLTAAVGLMGLHTLLLPAVSRKKESWTLADLAELQKHTQGAPIGYFAKADRNWWIPKHALFGGLVESRIVRLNPLDERKTSHFSEAAYKIPFDWLPPGKDEPSSDWSIRLAQKLGIRHVIETWEDRLPKTVKAQCMPVWAGPGLMLYELPSAEGESRAGKVAATP